MQVPLLSEEKCKEPEDVSRLVMWVFRFFGFVNVLACLLVDVANITSVIKYSSLNCPSQKCGYGPISSPILEVVSDCCAILLSLLGVYFLLSRYSVRTVKPGLQFVRTAHNRVGKIGWWVFLSTVTMVYMNYFVFYDSTADSSTEEWLKVVEYVAKSVAAVCVAIYIWVFHNIRVTHLLHYEAKVIFAVCVCLFLPELSNVIFYIVVGVIQANQTDASVAASWIFFFMLATLASLIFTYLLKPSRIDEWRATLRMMAQVNVMSEYTPFSQKRLNSAASNAPFSAPTSVVTHSVPSHTLQLPITASERRRSLGGSMEHSPSDKKDEAMDPILAARNAAEEAVHKTEALAHDMRILKASTVFSRLPEHDDKDRVAVDQMRRELARVDESVQAQGRKIARLEAQLKDHEESQLIALKTAQAEAQTNVAEMTEQLEKLEAFVVSTSKMVSEAVKPKDRWWGN